MSDVDGKVTGIQGIPVSTDVPEDGYVLTYVAVNSDYEPKPQVGLRKEYFTSNGTWTCPAGVYNVILTGCGGGSGGGHGSDGTAFGGGGGGGGSWEITAVVSVIPGTSYAVVVGDGGVGSTAAGSSGGFGGTTSFGSLFFALGACGGFGQSNCAVGGCGISDTPYNPSTPTGIVGVAQYVFGCGGQNANSNITSSCHNYYAKGSIKNTNGGQPGANNSTRFAGAGGGGGPQGDGANGGDAGGTTGSDGFDASPNTGAGGGGGGEGITTGGNGGDGGSGYLYVIW